MSIKAIPYRNHLIIPADNRVAVLAPHAKLFDHEGKQMMLLPHKVDETQVLRNLGYEVRPPVMMNYDWPCPVGNEVYEAQKVTTALITTHKRSYVLNGLGTGKTRSALYAFDFLKKTEPSFGSCLITAPLSTIRQTWAREIEMVFPHLTYRVLHGSKAKRLALLDDPADLYIINHDGVEVISDELVERKGRFSLCILDELSVYKNTKTNLWKMTNRFTSQVDRCVGMTATPMTKDASDAYGQIKLLTPASLRGQSFTRFRETVQRKITQFKWVNTPGSVESVYKLMQPSVRFSRDECYDLPPVTYITNECELSAEQKRFYTHMLEGAAVDSHNIKAVNSADQINKLLQISLGVVYDVEHREVTLDASRRYAILDSTIEQSDSKVIVFTPYKSSLRHLHEHLSKSYTVEVVSGDVSAGKREQIFTAFMHSPDPHVIVAHPATMSHGLTLTEASTIIWWGPPQSLEVYEQANGRITRAGQKNKQLIVHLVSTKIEERAFKILRQRGDVQNVLLSLFESQDKSSLM